LLRACSPPGAIRPAYRMRVCAGPRPAPSGGPGTRKRGGRRPCRKSGCGPDGRGFRALRAPRETPPLASASERSPLMRRVEPLLLSVLILVPSVPAGAVQVPVSNGAAPVQITKTVTVNTGAGGTVTLFTVPEGKTL